MPTFDTRRIVPFTPGQIYDIVADVESYPKFLPFCEGLTILSRKPTVAGEEIVAAMTIGYKIIRETFSTRVRLDPAEPVIRVEYVDGPFSHLENVWHFRPVAGGAEIEFFIDYEFRSSLLAAVAGAAFNKAVRSYTDAFEARARLVYGGVSAT
ncbi:MAG: type II toxin-antitoxin system RatA family toxin [Hyphomicrobium sp.]